jgi:hypothetical protein
MRDEVAYVMNRFAIARRHDQKEHGDYRTKLTIHDLRDAMAHAIAPSQPYPNPAA